LAKAIDRVADEPDSWRRWWERHAAALLLLARQHCATRADAEDALQDGFVRFWRARDRAADPAAYLFACVRSAAIDLTRGRRRGERRDLAAGGDRPGANVPLFDVPLERAERRAAVEAALETLPPEQREVVVMKIWGGLTFAQVAAALAVSPDTAASRFRYGLKKLEPLLAKEVVP
jgi:RNA polymerase sigma-70 factor (ECF subfamily)